MYSSSLNFRILISASLFAYFSLNTHGTYAADDENRSYEQNEKSDRKEPDKKRRKLSTNTNNERDERRDDRRDERRDDRRDERRDDHRDERRDDRRDEREKKGKESPREEKIRGYTHKEIKSRPELLKAIATKITNQDSVIAEAEKMLKEKHSQAAFELWSRYNDHNTFPPLNTLYSQMESVSDFRIVMKSKIFDVQNESTLKKRLRTFVGRKSFTLFSEDTINGLRVLIPQAVSSPSQIILTVRTHGSEIKPDEDIIAVYHTFAQPVGFLYQKENTKSESIRFTKEKEPKSEVVISIDAKPYLDALEKDKDALSGDRFLGGSILSIQSQ